MILPYSEHFKLVQWNTLKPSQDMSPESKVFIRNFLRAVESSNQDLLNLAKKEFGGLPLADKLALPESIAVFFQDFEPSRRRSDYSPPGSS